MLQTFAVYVISNCKYVFSVLKISLSGNNKEYGFATRIDTKSRNEECPCDEIQTDIKFLQIENNRRQGEIALHDTRLDLVENDVAAHTIRLNTVENDVADHDTRLDTLENPVWFDAYR